MGSQMQKYHDQEKIQEERIRFNNYQKEFQEQIKQADNDKLREWYKEFVSTIDNKDAEYWAYKFYEFMINKR